MIELSVKLKVIIKGNPGQLLIDCYPFFDNEPLEAVDIDEVIKEAKNKVNAILSNTRPAAAPGHHRS